MEIIATQKFLLMSPRKIRPVADLIKRMKPADAIAALPFTHKKAAEPLIKVIKSAIANSRAMGLSETDLVFREIQIGEGPRLKRGNPVSRGQWHPIKKRMSHIRVVLTTQNDQVSNSKIQTSSNNENSKIETKIKKGEAKLKTK